MLKHLTISLLFLLTCNTHAAEVALPVVKKSAIVLSHEVELTKFKDLIKQHRDKTEKIFGKQRAKRLCVAATITSLDLNLEVGSLYLYVPLYAIGCLNDSATMKTDTGLYEFTLEANKYGMRPQETIAYLKKTRAKRLSEGLEKREKDPSTQQDLTEEQLDEMSEGNPATRMIIERLAQVEKDTGNPCVIL